MNDIRIPDWQSRGRGFVSLILHWETQNEMHVDTLFGKC
jgi:hypothetical protein